MSRTTLSRLARLEQRITPPFGKYHTIMGSSEELAEKEAQIRASDAWKDGDEVFAILLVAVKDGKADSDDA